MLPYFHLNQASTVHYMAEREGDQSHPPDLFTLQASDASHPFRPCPILFSNLQDRCHIQHHPSKQQANEPFLITGASNRLASNTLMDDDDGVDHNLKLSLCDHYVKEERAHAPSCKWMPSKLPITGKTMSSESDRDAVTHARPTAVQVPVDRSQQQSMQDSGASDDSNPPCGNNIVRVCSDCRTTKTPLWRSGPCGPKTLCNACGIRQRKARRAMAAAAVNSGLLPPHRELTPAKMRKYQKKLDAMPFKKRCKPLDAASSTTTAQAKLCLEDHVTLSLSTSSTFDRVLPQDERDAAILLMGLSCGIIRS